MVRIQLLFLWLVWWALPTAHALDILLTNNNGIQEFGLQSLKTALQEAGHSVTVVAPSQTLMGASSALDLPFVNVTQIAENEYMVDGFPATCILVGLSLENAQFDLVVSGINDGFNSAAQDWLSGTLLGGAMTGLANDVPSIALLTAPPDDVTDADLEIYLSQVVEFSVDLVETIQDDITTWPRGVGLKVIYPTITNTSQLAGIQVADNNDDFFVTFNYVPSEDMPDTELETNLLFLDPSNTTNPLGDYHLVQQGFITVLPIQSDLAIRPTRYNDNWISSLQSTIESMDVTMAR